MSIPAHPQPGSVIVTVRGEHETTVRAELAVATVSVRLDGPDRADVLARATALADQLAGELAAAQSAGGAARWSSDRIAVWSDRPWSQDGAVLPLVHHASATTRSEFTDFAALADWLSAMSEREGVAVDDVSWQLTDATARATEQAVAQAAVGVAVARARAYAEALGLGEVVPLEVADTGLLTAGADAAPRMEAMAMKSFDRAGGGAPGFVLEPRELRVSSTVEARFSAR